MDVQLIFGHEVNDHKTLDGPKWTWNIALALPTEVILKVYA